MRAFTVVWVGQFVSLTGSAMTAFALTIWAFQLTGQATALALVAFFNFLPMVLFSPIAGALVDRWNRKLVMMLSDVAGLVGSIAILLLFSTGGLQIGHLYVITFLIGFFQAFQWPAYSASIALMLDKKQYGRAQGMLALAEAGSGILAPSLAAALLVAFKLGGILVIDIASFAVALVTLWVVHVPQPKAVPNDASKEGGFLREVVFGFRYIWERPSLLGLQLCFFATNFSSSLAMTLFAPLILLRTNQNAIVLGNVQAAAAAGGVLGGLLMTAWGGPKRRVLGVLGGMGVSGLLVAVFGLSTDTLVWAVTGLAFGLSGVIVNSSNQAIWQSKVAPEVQGRVFATRRLIAQLTIPLGTLLAGPLADNVFGPALMPEGSLVGSLGHVFGVGPGAGVAVLVVITGIVGAVTAIAAYAVPAVRNAETLLPDHQGVGAEMATADAAASASAAR